MPSIGEAERLTQNRLVKFFIEKLRYIYMGNLHDVEDNSNIIVEKLQLFLLRQGYSASLAGKAINEIEWKGRHQDAQSQSDGRLVGKEEPAK